MTASFTTLSADHVNAYLKALVDVLRVADHVHVEHAGFVEALDNMDRRDTHGRDK